MKKVVSFSGGRTSAYLCKVMIEKFGKDNVDFIYMDTGAEHPKTYEFIRKVNEFLGLDLVCLRTDFNTPLGEGNKYHIVSIDDIGPDLVPFREMMEKYGTPYIGGMFCTDRMKLVPFTKYCNDVYGKGNYETWLGIRADEPKRLTPKKGIRYMAEISDFEKEDVLDWWEEQPFDLGIPEWLGNCVFCPKKSDLKLAAAAKNEPAMYRNFYSAITDGSVRGVASRTVSYMREIGIKEYRPFTMFRRSEEFKSRLHTYNTTLFSDLNPKWPEYEFKASVRMYRKHRSLEQVIGMFDSSTGDEIKARIRGGKMTDTGSCSESCEVFVCEANQIDMF